MTRKWTKSIHVIAWVDSLRIGGHAGRGVVDLPISREKGSWISTNIASTFRGTLRRTCHVMLRSTSVQISHEDPEMTLFGTYHGGNPQATSREGKIKIVLRKLEASSGTCVTRNGIRIDPLTGSVETNALYNYEYIAKAASQEVRNGIALDFEIEIVPALDEIEAAVLLGSIQALKYASLGGFKSRGLGLIRDVEIKDADFIEFAG
nr:hypothetical protein [Candidatus Sigynarchaeota archaeon]